MGQSAYSIAMKEMGDLINKANLNEAAVEKALEPVNSQLADIGLNVKIYGAKGDGATDDTVAIQAAIDALTFNNDPIADSQSGVVFFPTGEYRVTNTIKIKGGVSLRGSGRYSTIIINTTTNKNTFEIDEALGSSSGSAVSFSDMQIVGAERTSATSGNAIDINYDLALTTAIDIVIERCDIFGHFNGVAIGNTITASIRDCLIRNTGNDGVISTGTMNLCNITTTYSSGNVRHGYNVKGNYCSFNTTGSDSNGGDGYRLHTDGVASKSNSFKLNVVGAEHNAGAGINVQGGLQISIDTAFLNPTGDHCIVLKDVQSFVCENILGLTPTAGKYGIFQSNCKQLILSNSYFSASLGITNDISTLTTINYQSNAQTPNVSLGSFQTQDEPLSLGIPQTGNSHLIKLSRSSVSTFFVGIESGGGLRIQYPSGVYPFQMVTGIANNNVCHIGNNGLWSSLGFILRSPNGTYYRMKVDNSGVITTEVVTSP